MTSKILLTLFFLLPLMAQAKLSVITTTTDIKWLAQKIGGDKVQVESLLNGTEDPHYIDAMPHFIGKVANADLFCLVGMELEIGWAPKILSRSGNKHVQPGGRGYCETGKSVKALNVPTGKIDRSQGDIHPQGNPHYHLSPTAFLQGAQTILDTLITVDSKNAEYYLKQFEALESELNSIKKKVTQILEPVQKSNFLEYHREFTYFMNEYKLNNLGAVEKVPGVPPSAGRLARVSITAKNQNIYAVLATTTSPSGILKKFNEMSKIPVVKLPLSILDQSDLSSYGKHQEFIARKILQASIDEK
ncbi:metal ABC transporter substrate-binding protein [Halobacteriovorax sp. HLS]|uniref:metal ABC transporter substrate-binding protein n=1 Tax=Halobacteriovorax sp. HLS TaxID=2234000 RepID=UPI000FD7627E|nr:metal ABC transporter substrate-binding protein [Halobacteriovorax sp. HLS]